MNSLRLSFITFVICFSSACGSGGENSDAVAQGRQVYQQHCASCHGEYGRGDGPAGQAINASDLTDSRRMGNLTDEAISSRIENGGDRMPALPHLTEGQRQSVVQFVRTL